MFCNECRFCCTLGVCTTPTGLNLFTSTFNSTTRVAKLRGESNVSKTLKTDATSGFLTNKKMWKSEDFRCLKPKSTDPNNWPHYEMEGFRKAANKKELEAVKEIKFDKYFFNLEDPYIFNEMVNGKKEKRRNIWTKTYGFDYVNFNTKKGGYTVRKGVRSSFG